MDALEALENAAENVRIFCLYAWTLIAECLCHLQAHARELRKEHLMDEETKETSAAVAGLLSLLKSIEVTPERIAQNQWKSVNKNGEVEFYY